MYICIYICIYIYIYKAGQLRPGLHGDLHGHAEGGQQQRLSLTHWRHTKKIGTKYWQQQIGTKYRLYGHRRLEQNMAAAAPLTHSLYVIMYTIIHTVIDLCMY